MATPIIEIVLSGKSSSRYYLSLADLEGLSGVNSPKALNLCRFEGPRGTGKGRESVRSVCDTPCLTRAGKALSYASDFSGPMDVKWDGLDCYGLVEDVESDYSGKDDQVDVSPKESETQT
ncbi:hypothetical protein N7532_006295 [Penicillium argentinense]|uniref:Uncharacterized protein n=1 Tax=Penicillium argentinense TaxID=1131581 RepID=A0A9W9FFN1_9EURO|nr:uncharacterized protein N7532_006295 [Penicillium argentinense]KAJ5099294.1 hypothetical protein N7532_006295 [Penicillium argentinense]